ncbi:hypothetical protein [Prauserella cavernicola]|uniref:Uncharacterized protein n=1 Tax=Prauserella cavernicola TaxID=2800127 RepID=A0A934V1Z9_9PSEU|nr:hypothetical protein [Prauserella cavernicola]MBK1784301.1 hypothetical protein [Prauserella cavernicola]
MSLGELAGRLLIQCTTAQASAAARVARAHSTGLVVTGGDALTVARQLKNSGFRGPLLCDANRYSGTKRVVAGRGVNLAWCREQQALGLVALTDSGYLGCQNWPGLWSILSAVRNQRPPVIALLPLAAAWFRRPTIRAALIRQINEHGVPVALAIEHAADPFGVQYVIEGFLDLLSTARVPVLLLRSDIAALAALCHGAYAAAIGTTSTLRHIYPITDGPVPRPQPSAFVTPLLGHHRLSTIADVVRETPDLAQHWDCDCDECAGHSLDRLAAGQSAWQHSLYAQLRLSAQLLRTPTDEGRRSSWHEHCSHALNVHEEIRGQFPRWRVPKRLENWLTVTDDPLLGGRNVPLQVPRQQRRVIHPEQRG